MTDALEGEIDKLKCGGYAMLLKRAQSRLENLEAFSEEIQTRLSHVKESVDGLRDMIPAHLYSDDNLEGFLTQDLENYMKTGEETVK